MINYTLRHKDELLEELRVLGLRKKKIDDDYRILLSDIEADVAVIAAEIDLLKTLGLYSGKA